MADGVKVLVVAAEAAPVATTGGLGEVIGSLPRELRRQGVDARIIMPDYSGEAAGARSLTVTVGSRRRAGWLRVKTYRGVPYYLVGNPAYFQRPKLYGYPDDAERFAFFCRAALAAGPETGWRPQIVHCHDWHTGPAVFWLGNEYRGQAFYRRTKTVFTVHNLSYQGLFAPAVLTEVLGLGREHFTPAGWEFYNQVSYIKAGLGFADQLTTVSPAYAAEIQQPDGGEGLDGLLRRRAAVLTGITNGIDYEVYNPATDSLIFQPFSATEPAGKSINKRELQKRLGLAVDDRRPLMAIVSRLADQKGLDLVIAVLDELLAGAVQLVVLGGGEAAYETAFAAAAGKFPAQVAVNFRFDDQLAHQVYAAADLFLMPSRFEPCGIGQLIAMRYGGVPVVRATGGLKDTVRDCAQPDGTGFVFADYQPTAFRAALGRALRAYADQAYWEKLTARVLRADHSWRRPAREYRRLYDQLLAAGE